MEISIICDTLQKGDELQFLHILTNSFTEPKMIQNTKIENFPKLLHIAHLKELNKNQNQLSDKSIFYE